MSCFLNLTATAAFAGAAHRTRAPRSPPYPSAGLAPVIVIETDTCYFANNGLAKVRLRHPPGGHSRQGDRSLGHRRARPADRPRRAPRTSSRSRPSPQPAPGRRLRALFDERWPAYRRWYLRDGWDARPSLDEGRKALERHMPELVPVHASIVDAVGADELGARMLTLFDPPPILSGCSQVALADPPGARAQLRLRRGPVRRGRARHALARAPRDRHERSAVGPARRHQRRRAGRLLHVRRPQGAGPRLQRPARRPLPARDVHDGARGGRRAAPDPRAGRLQRDGDRPRRRPRDGVARPRPPRRGDAPARDDEPPGPRRLAAARALDAQRGAAGRARGGCWPIPSG